MKSLDVVLAILRIKIFYIFLFLVFFYVNKQKPINKDYGGIEPQNLGFAIIV